MDQRQRSTASELETMIESELRQEGCETIRASVEAQGDDGDWSANRIDEPGTSWECKHAFIHIVSRLQREYFFDYSD
ncbi:hypothetical protein [Methyloligella solikamskensis]|uniref:Uncharacterized protein n=1 Tax=Methyloligella solikamskensis TaxID=1177756 RepID=A0ABW3J7A5_9HYPH